MDVPALPKRTRPRVYAACELFLDILYSVRSRAPDMDLETLLIFLVVNEATMRPMLVGPKARLDLIDHPTPPDEVRGSISRNLISDRTGLPRETVRRKVNALIERGLFHETREGEVRPVPLLAETAYQQIADECFDAAQRYDARLRSLGCEGIASPHADEAAPSASAASGSVKDDGQKRPAQIG